MLITDEIVYLELQKTGCSHTLEILKELYNKNSKIIGKHNTYDYIKKDDLGNFESKLKIGNIRNPWDWYVSLWAFGCQRKGRLYNLVTNQNKGKLFSKKRAKSLLREKIGFNYPKLDSKVWSKLYLDPFKIENFSSWLKLILTFGKHDIGEGYKNSEMSSFAGLLTYRYIKLYTYGGKKYAKKICSLSELIEINKKTFQLGAFFFVLKNKVEKHKKV